jgi:two-component system, NtrC family, response regulator AtoC
MDVVSKICSLVVQLPDDPIERSERHSQTIISVEDEPRTQPDAGRTDTVHMTETPACRQTLESPEPRRLDLSGVRVWIADPATGRLLDLLERVARGKLPILLHGETGVGKEIAAKAIHRFSSRRDRTMVSINCAAIPEGLAESELFGHEKGAFSGATTTKLGLFETAVGGTVFLDEVGDLPASTQARLLRALDSHRVSRVGAVVAYPIDVRIVAATNRDLRADVKAGRFREDLFYRLNGASVTVPPLRDRPLDLPLIARELLADARSRLGRGEGELSDEAMRHLSQHRWPGNVRELKHAMEYAAALAEDSVIEVRHLPPELAVVHDDEPPVGTPTGHRPQRLGPIADELRALERLRMRQALEQAQGHQGRAAAMLAMPRRTFITKMQLYKLDSPSYRRKRAKSAR